MKNQSVVILHGWGLSGAVYEPLARCFKNAGYDVHTPDLPGFGRTETPRYPLRLADYADFLHQYLGNEGISPTVLIGHSFGGRVALKFQSMYPENVRALILSGTPGFSPVNKIKRGMVIFLAKLGKIPFSLPFLRPGGPRLQQWYYRVIGANDYNRARGVMRDTFKRVVQEDLGGYMADIRVPCVLVWGENDAVVPVGVARRMHRVIPGSGLAVVPQAGHGLPYQNAETFTTYAVKFLNSI